MQALKVAKMLVCKILQKRLHFTGLTITKKSYLALQPFIFLTSRESLQNTT